VAKIEGGSGFFWSLPASYAVRMANCLTPSDLQGIVLFHPNRRAKRGSGAYGSACAFVVVFYFFVFCCCVLQLLCLFKTRTWVVKSIL
jgi:hypothetical protein